MCNLMQHSERSSREREAKQREPIYTSLAEERGIPYEPPQGPEQGPFSRPEKDDA